MKLWFSSLQQSGMKRMKNRRNKFLILMLFAAARAMRYFRLRRMNNSRISAVKVRHRDTIYGQAEIRGVRERSRRIGGMHVTFKRYCRAVSPRRRPSFPEKFARQWRERRGRFASPYILRSIPGARRELRCLYLSVADSKFTSAIVVRNVLSIYPVTFIPAMPRRRFLACPSLLP